MKIEQKIKDLNTELRAWKKLLKTSTNIKFINSQIKDVELSIKRLEKKL